MKEKNPKWRILIVDDSPATIDVIKAALENDGYDIMAATTGEEAVARAKQAVPDLILLDVLMPGIDGFETCRLLKLERETGDVPVVFMTGLTTIESKVACFEAGGADYVTKPIDTQEVLARIQIHLAFPHMQKQLKKQNMQLQYELTAHRKAEQEVLAINAELERRVEERSIELNKIIDQLNNERAERKRAEEALREREKKVKRKIDDILIDKDKNGTLELVDIIDSEKIQTLMDKFYQLTNIGIGIIDLKGNVLVGTGWQDICTKFHRVHPESRRLCIESDLELSSNVPVGTFKQYRCKNLMWDIATPIMLCGKHMGNIFLGQFLFDDETPEYEAFRRQAHQYGFNEEEYLAALERVPRWSHQKVDVAMSFYTAFAEMLGDLSYSNIKLANALEESKRAEQERLAHLRSFECMALINQAIQGTNDLERMMSDVLDVVLSIFDCDRAFLMYPCDPEAAVWSVPMERNRHEYPSVLDLGIEMPMDAEVAETLRILLAADGPVKFGPGTPNALPEDVAERFGFKSFMSVPIHPKVGSPWQFGIHQCSYARVWTAEEERLLLEIGRRLGDALTSLSAYRDLKEREAHYRAIVGAFGGLIYICSQDYRIEFMNDRFLERTGYNAVGDLCYKALHGRDSVCPWCANGRVFQGETVRWEIKSPKDGRWYHTVNTPIYHADGSVSKQAMITDITERKRAESIVQARLRLLELSNSCSLEELLTATLDEIEALTGSAIGFYHFLESDQRTLSLQSWSTNTLESMCAAEGKGSHYDVAQAGVWVDCIRKRGPVIHNDYAALPHRKGMPEGHAPVLREVVVPVFRGNLIKAIIGVGNKSSDYDENDVEIVSQVGDISWDIAERMQAEEALKRAEGKYRSIFENTVEGIFQTTPEGRYLSVNPALARMHGYDSPQDMIANVTDVGRQYYVKPENRARLQDSLEEHGLVKEFVTEVYRKNGSRIWVSINAHAVRDSEGGIQYYEGTVEDVTDSKRAEEALRESEERYRTIFQNSPLGIFRTTVDGRFLEANPAAAKLFGYDSPETLIREIHDIGQQLYAHPEDRKKIILEQKRLYGVTQRINHYRRKDGSELIANLYLRTIRDAEGRTVFFDGIIEDITDRIGAEEALRRSEERTTILNRIANIFLTIPDEEMFGEVLDVVLEVTESEFGVFGFIGNNGDLVIPRLTRGVWSECQVPDKSIVFPASTWGHSLWGRSIREKRSFSSHGPFHTPEGHIPIDCFLAAPIVFGNKAIGLLSVANKEDGYTDEEEGLLETIAGFVSPILNARLQRDRKEQERRRAEEALLMANETLRATLEAAPVAIFDLDTQGRVKGLWNAAAKQMLGWGRDEVIGRVLPSVQKDKEEEFAHFREWMRSGKRMMGHDVVGRRQDGSLMEYSIYAAPEYDHDGKVIGSIAVLVDITDRKQAENEIRKLNMELEQRVRDRTARLEAANKELEAFAYSVSHDLRAPLRHIDGFLELLQNRTATIQDEKSQHYMEVISESAKKMGILIDDLLSFSRMGRSEMTKKQVDLAALVQEAIREIAPEAEGRTVRWKIGDLPTVTGDCAMLRIVLVNLISNALKFTRQREHAEIEIGCTGEKETEPVIFVRDNGVGFDMAYGDKLFRVFQRLHHADEFEGTGIGLANVRRIIDRHGGRTWAEGEINQGATFFFSLPTMQQGG